ncbi:MAG: VIT domain-containing protein [Candidatus Sedimenticola endophacoides]
MSRLHIIGRLAALVLMLGGGFSTAAAAGLLTPADATLPSLEIREHRVEVTIEEGYATTRVEQIFHNPHDRDLEAIYSFPVPEKGAVGEFTVWIDGQPVTGEVLERRQARQLYQEEKAAVRDAGLVEQEGYKSFDIRVSPVRARGDTRIRLVYIQPAYVDSGLGRYLYPLEEGGVDEQRLAFWTATEQVRERFSFRLKLKSAWPVDALRAPDHPQAVITGQPGGGWDLLIEQGTGRQDEGQVGPNGGMQGPVAHAYTLDRDIAVYWRQAGGLQGAVDLNAYKPDEQGTGTFMMVLTPGDDLGPITEGATGSSCSMSPVPCRANTAHLSRVCAAPPN